MSAPDAAAPDAAANAPDDSDAPDSNAAAAPRGPVRRTPRHGLARRIARLTVNLVYRDLDVQLPEQAIPDGPVLAVANHFGGLADGVLLVDSLPRMPRVVARDVIWKVPLMGALADALGGIPVHRSADGARMSNDEMFASCYDALDAGELVLIFPEGVTQDVPHMAEVRTGAARILLGARAAGVTGISLLPIGLHYENKAGFRSQVLVNVGAPMALDEWLARTGGYVASAEDPAAPDPPVTATAAPATHADAAPATHADAAPAPTDGPGPDDHGAVRSLTHEVDARLRAVAPDFPDWATARSLETVAEVLLRDVDPDPVEVRYGDLATVSSQLNRAPEEARAHALDAGRAYRRALSDAGTDDRAVAQNAGDEARAHPRSWIPEASLVALLSPYALIGLISALIPLLLVGVLSRLPIAPAVRATLVPGVALLAFVGEALVLGAELAGLVGWTGWALALVSFPLFVAALFLVHEKVSLLWQRWATRRRRGRHDDATLQRLRTVAADRGWAAL